MIEKILKDKYVLKSKKSNKKLGEFRSLEDAKKREKQINFFKALKAGKIK